MSTRGAKVPEKIKIGPYEVEVRFVKNKVLDRNHLGEYVPREMVIEIDEEYAPKHAGTLLHEILEIINDIYDLNLAHHTINVLETSLLQVLRDNKLVF